MSSPQMSSENHAPADPHKAVVLFSGGLDSVLAVHLTRLPGISVTAIHFTSPLSQADRGRDGAQVTEAAREIGVELVFLPKDAEFLELVRNPRYGRGKNMNPCIDCRIHTLRSAKAYMERIGASFIVTGEVVGQRPMSQGKNTMRMIEKRADCDGIVLRPLCGAFLPPTRMEIEGVIDREKLLSIAGRGRKAQLKLAHELGLTKFAAPAGGCLLTDRIFSRKVRDLLAHTLDPSRDDLDLLRIGRHIRIRPDLKFIVGRDESENMLLERLKEQGVFFESPDFSAPAVLVRGVPTEAEKRLIASVLLRYTKAAARGTSIVIEDAGKRERFPVSHVVDEEWLKERTI